MIDQTDGRVLPNVTVTFETKVAKTKADGTVNLGTLPRNTVVKVKLEKESYQAETRDINPNCSAPIIIALKPMGNRITLTWLKEDMDLRLMSNDKDCPEILYSIPVCGNNSLGPESSVNMH